MIDKSKPRKMSEHALILYRAMFESISFLKKQQWAVTNYVSLIYGAIFWFGHYPTTAKVPRMPSALISIAIVAALVSIFLIWKFQTGLAEARQRMLKAELFYFNANELEAFDVKDKSPYRGLDVMFPLMMVSAVGAALVVWSLM